MAKRELSSHQQGVIKNYYENLDTIMLQKLQELVTDLYLATSDAKKKQLWNRVEKAMMKIEVPASVMEHILEKRNVELLAKHLTRWLTAE